MPVKQYDAEKAINPETQQAEGIDEDINFEEFIQTLPEEFQDEIAEALTAILSYIHSEEGTNTILTEIEQEKGGEAKQIGIAALKAMDVADGDHGWTDSAKVFAGYFAVSEIAMLAREAGIVDISDEEEEKIYQDAAQNYMRGLIMSKPTQEERDAEAIRLQKEVDPLVTDKMREAGHQVAKEKGIPTTEDRQNHGGLLE